MYIRIYATHQDVKKKDLKNKKVVVIDTLRATSTIVTALAHGCRQIFPVSTTNEAKILSSSWSKEEVVLGGEYRGYRFAHFNYGNSPLEYEEEAIKGKNLFLVTTNGTVALQKTSEASEVLVASLLNGRAIADYISHIDPAQVILLCSGTQGHFCLEDTITAGKIIYHLSEKEGEIEGDEMAIAALQLYQLNKDQLLELMKLTDHGQRLIEQGYEQDLNFCLREDIYPIIPQLSLSRIRLLNRGENIGMEKKL
ncbi:2-phosphosulfolactate phosphatase [Heliorestis convoluta]|uniref:Probable 2-phosphosulfolactate phosphatase n=1 Tax=Heliorestis convoluta TaxID=356322 RepID=A0A5Q2N154_9FIRM|nr:2-phosphosulfolactate phosphatase [Heliorestis convoluta]QGG47022.1 2-phosphosulfolactate phosphatase ComB [Heliorestis convoluta]